jgi:hypothetical protein
MTFEHVLLSGTAALAFFALSSLVEAQVQTQTIDTRIGKLQIENGFPTAEAAKKLFEESDFQRATQAYLWALPAVGFEGLHLAHLNIFGAKDGHLVLYETLKDKAGMLTPNLTTVYAMSFWNMAEKGPLVIEVPAGLTAGGALDVWQRPVTDTGQTGPDKGNGAKYLIVPPGSPEVNAPGYIVKRSPTNQLWFATRGLALDPKEAVATLSKHRLYSWSDRANPPTTKIVPVGGKDWSSEQPRDIKYWQYLSDVLAPEPMEPRDGFLYAMLLPLGIQKGQPFKPTDAQKKVLTDAAVVGDLLGRATAYSKRIEGAAVYPGRKWEYSNMVELNQQSKGYAQLDERASWFYEAIGNSVGMQGKTLGFGQVYLESQKDSTGAWLDGGKSYHLKVPANPPVKQFWSFTIYDNLTRGPVITSQGAADISSRKPDLLKNADGSVDLYFGPQKPAGANANYVETLPGRGWFTYFRLYGPTQAYFDKTWQLPDIEQATGAAAGTPGR